MDRSKLDGERFLQRAGKQQPPFDAVLKRGLDKQRNPGGAECPDAATLAAYWERALPADQSARWEEHFSTCARCQGALAAIARARTPDRAAARRLTARRWELYAALAAGVAGISIVATLMRPERRALLPADTISRSEMAAPAQAYKEAPPRAKDSGAVIALNEPARPPNPPPEPRSAGEPAAGELMGLGPRAIFEHRLLAAKIMKPGTQRRKELKEPGVHSFPAMRAFVGESSPTAGAGSQQQLAKAETRPEAEGVAAPPLPPAAPMLEREIASSNAPGAPRSAPAGGSPPLSAASIADQGRPPRSVLIRTADGVERWRLGANGTIEHLTSDGHWMGQDSGVTVDLSAGAAPSFTVCWAVGAGGTVLRTTDGEHWHKLAAPTAANLATVSAQDADSAVVTTGGGQRFATADGGRTWQPM